MKQNKKKLYENIMTSVAKEVKKALNEGMVIGNHEMIFRTPYDDLADELKAKADSITDKNLSDNLYSLVSRLNNKTSDNAHNGILLEVIDLLIKYIDLK